MTTSSLNEQQKAAVMYNEGPSLVIAGAGSGKTRVLTYKIAYLMEVVGLKPYQIMALTFTNKAAREMKQRIATMVGEEKARHLAMGTFHSQFVKILRAESSYLDLPSNFTVYDTSDSKSLIKSIVKEMQLDDKTYKPSAVLSRISAAKNKMIMPEAYDDAAGASVDFMRRMPKVKAVYAAYQNRLRQAGAVDFDDMLCLTNRLFAQYPQVLEKYQNRFQYILVDEYQDTNYAQYLIIKALAAKHHRVCVVGDDSQSIYAFRGADISNILHFQKEYAPAKLFKLEQNYRSTQMLVEAANSLIAHNRGRIPKHVFSENAAGEPVQVVEAYSDTEEAHMVAMRIARLTRSTTASYGDIAVLYRINALSRSLEDAMRNQGIPYVIYGGQSFYQRKEIKDVLAYLRLLVNPSDEEAFKRCVNYPARGIGETTINKVKEVSSTQQVSLFEVASNPLAYNLPVNAPTAKRLMAFTESLQHIAANMQQQNAYEVAVQVLNMSGIVNALKASADIAAESDLQNIDQLLGGIKEYVDKQLEEEGQEPTLAAYLTEVALLTDADNDSSDDADKVTLMTVHAAKGLEFPHVFVVGLEEELFPSCKDVESTEGIEEERRLLYVAITRAKEQCFLSYAKSRFRNGKTMYGMPSRFIREIDKRYVQHHAKGVSSFDFSRKDDSFFSRPTFVAQRKMPGLVAKPSAVSANTQSFTPLQHVVVGQKVLHEKFGIGVVSLVEESASGTRVKVQFEHSGERLLLLKFAKLKIID
ncbi:MAG: UvrD-helicase domain-containing protein [Paludibacteraceae bacterium]|nr:UvrD-helicase domain-containing protein [Paludibacteraceae bacterium]